MNNTSNEKRNKDGVFFEKSIDIDTPSFSKWKSMHLRELQPAYAVQPLQVVVPDTAQIGLLVVVRSKISDE